MLLSAERLTVGYPGAPILSDLSFQVPRGEVLAVVGHNGSGKSTLVKTILGVLAPLAGRLRWPAGRPPALGYLGQMTDFDRRFPIRVRDLAAMGAWTGAGAGAAVDARRRAQVEFALEQAGVAEIADRSLHTLSAGQLQRALFARTIVQDAPVILLDEPFSAVDQTTEAQLLALIDAWAAEGRAVILVLHDLSAVLRHCGHALLLGDGRARFGPPGQVLTPENLVDQGYMSARQADWFAHLAAAAPAADAGPRDAPERSDV